MAFLWAVKNYETFLYERVLRYNFKEFLGGKKNRVDHKLSHQ